MAELESLPQPLCASAELAERGRAHLFEVQLWGQSARAFALRFDGRVVAYVNRCAHVPAEMDWQDRKSTRLNSSHSQQSRMPSSA